MTSSSIVNCHLKYPDLLKLKLKFCSAVSLKTKFCGLYPSKVDNSLPFLSLIQVPPTSFCRCASFVGTCRYKSKFSIGNRGYF